MQSLVTRGLGAAPFTLVIVGFAAVFADPGFGPWRFVAQINDSGGDFNETGFVYT